LENQGACSQTTLEKILRLFISQGKKRFYLSDMTRESGVPLHEAENFFIPLLKENELEGKLEVRCPNCGAELGLYKTYPDVPKNLYCEFCGAEFSSQPEDLEIVLEVTGKFFRAQRK
jgi:DNA-directed RNA polymerase subunit RPC12/RpoP